MFKIKRNTNYQLILIINVIAALINIKIGTAILWGAVICIFAFQKGTLYEKILVAIAYSAPFYPFSFWGTHARLSLCTVLTALFGLICFTRLWKRPVKKSAVLKLFLLVISMTTYIISALLSKDTGQMLADTYQIMIICWIICELYGCKDQELSEVNVDQIATVFVNGIIAIVVGLYFQYAVYHVLHTSLGVVFSYVTGRKIFNLYITAKSILSYYISIGMIYYFIMLFRRYRIQYVIILGFLLGGILINNSRTGLACFAITAAIYAVLHLNKLVGNIKLAIFGIILVCGVLFVVQTMLESRSTLASFTDDNGRNELNIAVIKNLPSFIFYGIGGCAADYESASVMTHGVVMGVHNIILANMIQYGCIGGLMINFLLCRPIFEKNNFYTYLVMCSLLAGMMFASWQNGIFVVPVYTCAIINKHHLEGELCQNR